MKVYAESTLEIEGKAKLCIVVSDDQLCSRRLYFSAEGNGLEYSDSSRKERFEENDIERARGIVSGFAETVAYRAQHSYGLDDSSLSVIRKKLEDACMIGVDEFRAQQGLKSNRIEEIKKAYEKQTAQDGKKEETAGSSSIISSLLKKLF